LCSRLHVAAANRRRRHARARSDAPRRGPARCSDEARTHPWYAPDGSTPWTAGASGTPQSAPVCTERCWCAQMLHPTALTLVRAYPPKSAGCSHGDCCPCAGWIGAAKVLRICAPDPPPADAHCDGARPQPGCVLLLPLLSTSVQASAQYVLYIILYDTSAQLFAAAEYLGCCNPVPAAGGSAAAVPAPAPPPASVTSPCCCCCCCCC
jgi:hypothetical protein